MADGKIYITISDTRGGNNDVATAEAEAKSITNNNEKNALGLMAFTSFVNLVEKQANQYVNYTVGNIGNFTGSYQAQRDAEGMISAMGYMFLLAGSALAGLYVAGPVGAIVAASVTIASSLQSTWYRGHAEEFQITKTNRNISMIRNRLGLQGLTDGGRTGGY